MSDTECAFQVAPINLATHPQPNQDMLLTHMYGNLSQIARTWTASALVMGKIVLPTYPSTQKVNSYTYYHQVQIMNSLPRS